MLNKDKINLALRSLKNEYIGAAAMLDFNTPFELIIATVLSAQCTDVRVNKVTAELYKIENTPEGILNLGQERLQEIIKSCGLYQTKSKNIINLCRMLIEEYSSQVPRTMEELTRLPGVGRKTANVVMSNAFGIPAIAVDTHVFRVSNRIGLAEAKDVLNTEKDLISNIPMEMWSDAHHWLIYHGRKVCTARNPKCGICVVREYCEYFKKQLASR
ncbi:MAG: endonuclease III [Eubacteriaceae bacterium]|nr:endonuclease III [Eubacteriaceae bacterium]